MITLTHNLSFLAFPSFPQIRSDQISRSVMSDSLRPHESQHARPPCPGRLFLQLISFQLIARISISLDLLHERKKHICFFSPQFGEFGVYHSLSLFNYL